MWLRARREEGEERPWRRKEGQRAGPVALLQREPASGRSPGRPRAVLRRRPARRGDGEEQHGCVPLKTILGNRVKRAEVRGAQLDRELLEEYLEERAMSHHATAGHDALVQADFLDGWRRAIKSVHGDCGACARWEATGHRWAPRDEATRGEMLRLAAADVPADEVAALEAQVAALAESVKRAKAPMKASTRRRIFGPSFRRGAAPGASAIPNAYVAALAALPGGVDALFCFAQLEVQGASEEDDHRPRHAALLEPADCGELAPGDVHREPDRKLHPFAQTEVLVKFVETALIDEIVEELHAALEPRQLGLVTPDGPLCVVKLLRAWQEDIRRAEENAEELSPAEAQQIGLEADAIAELDLENAYGRFFQSASPRSASARSPRVAALAAMQWKHGRLRIWQRMAEGAWASDDSWRGGWQGSRLAQVMVAHLEGAFSEMPSSRLARVGVANDTYLVGAVRNRVGGCGAGAGCAWPQARCEQVSHHGSCLRCCRTSRRRRGRPRLAGLRCDRAAKHREPPHARCSCSRQVRRCAGAFRCCRRPGAEAGQCRDHEQADQTVWAVHRAGDRV